MECEGRRIQQDLAREGEELGTELGVGGALARTLLFYAAKSGDVASAKLAKELLDRMWKKFRDDKGLSAPETRTDYKRFGG